MKILYNDEQHLKGCFLYALSFMGQEADISVLKHLAKNEGYGNEYFECTYSDNYDDLYPRPEGYVAYICWEWDDDEIDTVVFFEPNLFYQRLKQICLRTALIHPFQLKTIVTCLAKIKHDLKLDK